MDYDKGFYTNNIGNRLKEIRLKNDLSIYKLSKILGISDVSILKNERNETIPSARILILYVNYFGIDGHWLLTGKSFNCN